MTDQLFVASGHRFGLSMTNTQENRTERSLEAFLLGPLDFDACLALEHRLVFEAGGRTDGQVSLLVCEHPRIITVGRLGSRSHIRLSPTELARRGLEVRWVNRGGGALLHASGQLAVYPIVPLDDHGLSVGEFLDRFEQGLVASLAELGVAVQSRTDRAGCRGLWARGGQVVACGLAVKRSTTYFGAYLNVDPDLRLFRAIDASPAAAGPMSSLVAERRRPVKMTSVRATMIQHLAAAFGCPRYHLYTGHPLLARCSSVPHEPAGRAH